MRISDWSSDVCSSDLVKITSGGVIYNVGDVVTIPAASVGGRGTGFSAPVTAVTNVANDIYRIKQSAFTSYKIGGSSGWNFVHLTDTYSYGNTFISPRSEEHTSELQSLMRT